MPSTLEGYFEMAALVSEPRPYGVGLSISEFNDMMPWHLDALLQFKAELVEKLRQARPNNHMELS